MALQEFAPITALFVISFIVTFIILMISRVFGPQRPSSRKAAPYESGMKPIGPAVRRLPVQLLSRGGVVHSVRHRSDFLLALGGDLP